MSAAPLIPEGARFEGLLSFERAARIDGELVGSAIGDGRLELGQRARIEGPVEVGSLRVEGTLDGDVRVHEKMTLCPGAEVRGRIQAAALEVSEGASIEGPVAMTPPDPS